MASAVSALACDDAELAVRLGAPGLGGTTARVGALPHAGGRRRGVHGRMTAGVFARYRAQGCGKLSRAAGRISE
jgi:hypothetical protein